MSKPELKKSIGFFLKHLTVGLFFTIGLAAISPQLAQAHSPPTCWDSSLKLDIKSCPVEPKRLCENGTLVPITQRYCSVSMIELHVLDNPLGQPLELLIRVEDGLVKSFRTLKSDLGTQVSFNNGKMILYRYYPNRPSDWEQRSNHDTCPLDVVGVSCKKIFTSTQISGRKRGITTFVETTYYPRDLTDYPEMSCMNEQIIFHVESHQSGIMPPLSIYC